MGDISLDARFSLQTMRWRSVIWNELLPYPQHFSRGQRLPQDDSNKIANFIPCNIV